MHSELSASERAGPISHQQRLGPPHLQHCTCFRMAEQVPSITSHEGGRKLELCSTPTPGAIQVHLLSWLPWQQLKTVAQEEVKWGSRGVSSWRWEEALKGSLKYSLSALLCLRMQRGRSLWGCNFPHKGHHLGSLLGLSHLPFHPLSQKSCRKRGQG